MNRYLVILVIIAVFVIPVTGMIIEEPPEEELTISPTITPIKTINPIIDPVYEVEPIVYTPTTTFVETVITTFSELIGLDKETIVEEKEEVNVEIDGLIIAIIPADSKFNGLEVHKICLAYQYGTTNWYRCEQELQ